MAKYPATITTDHPAVYASLEGETYAIHFPYSAEAVKLVKSSVPGVKFDGKAKVWRALRRWHRSLPGALMPLAEIAHGADVIRQTVVDVKRTEAQAATSAGRAAIEAMKPYTGGITLRVTSTEIVIRTAYHPSIVNLFRSLGGRFDAALRDWHLPLAAGTGIAAHREDIRAWHNETAAANRAATEAEDARHAALRASRLMVAADTAVGEVFERGGRLVVVESVGKIFRPSEDASSLWGTIGYADQVRYAYTRPATEAEEAEYRAAQERAAAEAAVAAARRAAIDAVAQGEAAPDTGVEPEGETIWRDDTHAATGCRTWIVAAGDWLYHLTYDGSDGGAWGTYNAGYNTRARRIPARPELIAAITAD